MPPDVQSEKRLLKETASLKIFLPMLADSGKERPTRCRAVRSSGGATRPHCRVLLGKDFEGLSMRPFEDIAKSPKGSFSKSGKGLNSLACMFVLLAVT